MEVKKMRIKFMEEFLAHGAISCGVGAEKKFGCSRKEFTDFINKKVKNEGWRITVKPDPIILPPSSYDKYIKTYKINDWEKFDKIFINDDGQPTRIDRNTYEKEKKHIFEMYVCIVAASKDDNNMENLFIYAFILFNAFNNGLDIRKAYVDLNIPLLIHHCFTLSI